MKRGFAALSAGRIDQATACCREVLTRKPDLVPGHFLVGLVALEAQQRKTAFSAFQSVTRLAPNHAAGWAHLARLYMTEGQVHRADAALAQAARHVRNEPVVFDLMGTVYSLMGEYGEAGGWFERAVGGQPDHPPYLLNRANNLVYLGKTGEANAIFERILKLQPDSPQAHWSLAGARKATDRAHIEQMQELAGRPGLHPRAAAFYYYAAGKELEDLEAWPEAFEAFDAGARARRQTVEYDEAAEIEMFEYLTSELTAGRLNIADAAPADGPIFVLGQPRTGTTLIDRIISSHPQAHSAGELQQFGLALRRLTQYADPRRFSAGLFEQALALDPGKVGRLYLETSRRMAGDAPRFTDKLPQNYLMIPFILAALPQARIVHVVRDPMDACFASFKQLFADAYLHSYDQREMARHHARYRALMQTWRERFPGRFYDIEYEAVTRDLEPQARALLDYLELPWDPAVLDFHRQSSAVSTASAVQVREPVHTRSVGRWRRYEKQLEPMRQELSQCLGAEGRGQSKGWGQSKGTEPWGQSKGTE